MKRRVISLLALTAMVTAMVCCCDAMSIEPSMEFKHNASIVANDIYNLFWTLNDDNATFEVHAKTLGYVGFGISKTGGMRDADIVIGWVKDGKAYFQDRYSTRNGEPEIDESQDWKLEEGREEGEYTILRFSRALENCDPFDVDITQDTMRIIYAFDDADPKESTGLKYHGSTNRGTKSLSLVNFENPAIRELPPDAFYIDLHFDKVQIPAKHTTYYCRGFQLPKLDKKHHVVMVEPLIQPGNEGLVHHFLGYICPSEFNETRYHTMDGECQTESMQEMMACVQVLFVYAVGSEPNYMPIEAGFPFGGSDSPEYMKLEMHYDNPQSQSGLVDSSGLRIWVTPTLRQYDAQMMTIGLEFWEGTTQVIPPKFKGLHDGAYCSKECMNRMMGTTTEVQAFSVIFHTHLLGTSLTLRHFRNGIELPPIAEDKYYDFNFQGFRRLKKLVTVKADDELIADCKYNSESRDRLTLGGESTQEEMCMVFLMFYPGFSGDAQCYSKSRPAGMLSYLDAEVKVTGSGLHDYKVVGSEYEGKNYIEIMNETDWTNREVRERFQQAITGKSTTGLQLCFGPSTTIFPLKMQEVKKPYVPEASCKKSETNNPTGNSAGLRLTQSLMGAIITLCLSFIVKL